MTITELTEIVADRIGAETDLVHGFFQSFVDVIIERLEAGDEVKIRGLGSFRWVDVREMKVPAGKNMPKSELLHYPVGKKVKFFPAKQFKSRRNEIMETEDEGMTKLGVELDDERVKTANSGTVDKCPVCLSTLDDAGACPKHGTEPFEPHGK